MWVWEDVCVCVCVCVRVRVFERMCWPGIGAGLVDRHWWPYAMGSGRAGTKQRD